MAKHLNSDNLLELFQKSANRKKERPFLWGKVDKIYQPWSWQKVLDQAQLIANALKASGLERGDRVILVSENRPQWCITDLAIMMAGGITVPAYTTNTIADHVHILSDCGAAFAICSNARLAKNLLPAINQVSGVKGVLTFDGLESESGIKIINWDEALELGTRSETVNCTEELKPDDLACLIYTSGTGGKPKGVMQTHNNILANAAGADNLLKRVHLSDDDVFLSFLPLSHAYEHTAGQFFPISLGAEIYYAESVENLSNDMLLAKPTILPCVPRLFEVLRMRILQGVRKAPPMRARLFHAALECGMQKQDGTLPFYKYPFDFVLDKLVRTKVKERFGGRLKAMVSGGAPLNPEIGRFFLALGVPVIQGYGQTEAAPVISANPPDKPKVHTVGKALFNTEVKVASDGEILVRGDNVMPGYWKNEAATSEVLIDDWLHTGDIGHIDDEGYISITDRKKDMIVNSGGDNISPQRIEGVLCLEQEIGQALVIGDNQPYIAALIVPHKDFMERYAHEKGLENDQKTLAGIPEFQGIIQGAISRSNTGLSNIEKVKRHAILEEGFTIENGLLTPTMKVKRKAAISLYEEQIKKLFKKGKD